MHHSNFSVPDKEIMLAIGHNEFEESQQSNDRPEENAGGSFCYGK